MAKNFPAHQVHGTLKEKMIKSVTRISHRLILLTLVVVFSLLLLFNTNYLLNIPPVWPDEAFIADSAMNIGKEGRNGTDLLKATLPGAENFGWGYPPLFFYTTAVWFKSFGFSIFNQRLLSLALGQIFLVLFFLLISKLSDTSRKNKITIILVALVTGLLATDEAYIKAIHIGRPEIQVLILGFISVYFYLKSLDKKAGNTQSVLAGLFLSLAFLSHYLAIIFMSSYFFHQLFLNPKKFLLTKNNWLLLIAFTIPVLTWGILISENLSHLHSDVILRLKYKTTSPYWIWLVFSSSPLITKLHYILYFIITWELALNIWMSKAKNGILVFLFLAFSWFWTYQWQAEYSFIFSVVFTYLALGYLILSNLNSTTSEAKTKFKVYLLVGFIMLLINLWGHFNILNKFSNGSYDYHLYTEKILELVPDNTTVYLSAIPDPYYGFKTSRNNKLAEYPIMASDKTNLIQVLDETDYIIYNSPLESVMLGDAVSPYIEKNAANIIPVGGDNQYKVFVIKLKPRDSRAH